MHYGSESGVLPNDISQRYSILLTCERFFFERYQKMICVVPDILPEYFAKSLILISFTRIFFLYIKIFEAFGCS